MNIKNLVLEAVDLGTATRDERGLVTFELFGVTHSVRITDAELGAYQEAQDKALADVEAELAEAEAATLTAKAKIEAAAKRKKPVGKVKKTK